MTKIKARRGQFYWLNHQPLAVVKPRVSVTNVLKIIDKPAIRWWYGKEVYLAMTIDPTLDQAEALSAPYKTSDKAKARGSTVHSIVEAYRKTGVKIKPSLKKYKGYAQAFHNWVKDNNVKILASEKTVISDKWGIAGTLDLKVKIGGKVLVVDAKTGKDIYHEAHIQTSAYKQILIDDYKEKIDGTGVVLLKEDGTYKYEQGGDHFEVFKACLQIWYYLNKAVCDKVGYEYKLKR